MRATHMLLDPPADVKPGSEDKTSPGCRPTAHAETAKRTAKLSGTGSPFSTRSARTRRPRAWTRATASAGLEPETIRPGSEGISASHRPSSSCSTSMGSGIEHLGLKTPEPVQSTTRAYQPHPPSAQPQWVYGRRKTPAERSNRRGASSPQTTNPRLPCPRSSRPRLREPACSSWQSWHDRGGRSPNVASASNLQRLACRGRVQAATPPAATHFIPGALVAHHQEPVIKGSPHLAYP